MAQTTNALNGTSGELGISANGSVWTNISGHTNKIDGQPSQNRQTGEVYTLDGDTAIVKAGKREPMDLTTRIVYTEQGADAFETVRPLFEGGSDLYQRWSPGGGDVGDFMYTSDAGKVSNFIYPGVAADEPAPILVGWTLRVPKITKSVIA